MTQGRYTLREEQHGGWSIVDIFTDRPAYVGGVALHGLDFDQANELVAVLDEMDRQR